MIPPCRRYLPAFLLILVHGAFHEAYSNPKARVCRNIYSFGQRDHRSRVQTCFKLLNLRGGRNCSIEGRATGSRTAIHADSDEILSEPQVFGNENEESQESNATGEDTLLRDDSEPSEGVREFVIQVRRMAESGGLTQLSLSAGTESEGKCPFLSAKHGRTLPVMFWRS